MLLFCLMFRFSFDNGQTSNWKKSLTLVELLDELEKDDIKLPEIITILPPENANADCDTDEDSGDEDLVILYNLPRPQLTAKAEIQIKPSVDNGIVMMRNLCLPL
ncbi:hypothetical protein QE152_g28420 [Popillia japonica]|uniref:Myostatin n=1 Tax=Popillia japonica TaxID=7064 RepID=A0AAW1JJJ2_POPJA